MYIDIKNEAIVSCTGKGFKYLRIETDSSKITLEGAPSILYFNKKNLVARTTVYDSAVYNDYILKLKPNKNYKITGKNGPDQGRPQIEFKTDYKAKIITASDSVCAP